MFVDIKDFRYIYFFFFLLHRRNGFWANLTYTTLKWLMLSSLFINSVDAAIVDYNTYLFIYLFMCMALKMTNCLSTHKCSTWIMLDLLCATMKTKRTYLKQSKVLKKIIIDKCNKIVVFVCSMFVIQFMAIRQTTCLWQFSCVWINRGFTDAVKLYFFYFENTPVITHVCRT